MVRYGNLDQAVVVQSWLNLCKLVSNKSEGALHTSPSATGSPNRNRMAATQTKIDINALVSTVGTMNLQLR